MNALYLRRRLKVIIPPSSGGTPLPVMAAMQMNLAQLGYVLSPEVCECVQKLSLQKLEAFYKGLVSALREMRGAHREFRPLYPNFPEQVMELTDAQLYWNALRHYWTNACQSCVIRDKCTTGKERRIRRWEHEDILKRVQKRLDDDPGKIPLRSKTVEHSFGTI